MNILAPNPSMRPGFVAEPFARVLGLGSLVNSGQRYAIDTTATWMTCTKKVHLKRPLEVST